MNIKYILSLIRAYFLVSLIGLTFVVTLFFIGYLIYKKVFHGKKSLTTFYTIITCLFIGNLLMIICATLLRQPSRYYGFRLGVFSSFISAWNSGTFHEWSFIVLNVLMFTPMGVLLSLMIKSRRRLAWCYVIGLVVSFSIETLQIVFKNGYFEIDDIIYNIIGITFGYILFSFFSIFIRILKQKIPSSIK